MSLIQNNKPTKEDQNFRGSVQYDLELCERRPSTIAIGESEEWIRNYIIRQGMMDLKIKFLGRMGMGSKSMESMPKEILKKLLSPDKDTTCKVERKLCEMEDLRKKKTFTSPDGEISLNFFFRSDDEFRHDYINRLITMKVMKPQPTQQHQDIIVFDWDDTLLCTTFLSKFEFCNLPSWASGVIKSLDDIASRLLKRAVESGPAFIITNAEEGWVEHSSNLFLPKVYEVLTTHNIIIISARTGNEEFFELPQWKLRTFMELKSQFDLSSLTNIICLGDSHLEIESAMVLSKQFSKSILKTIKLKESPRPEELVNELALIEKKYDFIYSEVKNLTITLEKRNPAEVAAPGNQQFPQMTPMTSTA